MTSAKSRLAGGLYEIGVGVSALEAAIAFWRAFGYAPAARGTLTAGAARALYGVASAVTAVRLAHGAARHGLIRLQAWQTPTGPGLGFAPLRATGSRWSVHRTDDIMSVVNHAAALRQQGGAIRLRGPMLNLRAPARGYEQRPFAAPIRASHNFEMLFPEARVVAMQRFGVTMARYGTISDSALLRTTEGCHMGLVAVGEDFGLFDFYTEALGFKAGRRVHIAYEPGYTPSDFFELAPGEHFTECDFEDPDSGDTLDTQLPGRLRAFLIHNARPQPDLRPRARPGQLGYGLYTVRLRDLPAARAAVLAYAKHGGARDVTAILADEFGTPAFSFTAPDGYAWLALEA